ncbi:MAG: hypothetical protein KF725_16585 [Cyclobacteriaceae bacterium]|nr:hypothetical protein [Cyclobacteriaceae bacterium]UYN87680.1 MAG: hypothetical protein KIT51_05315 [Cyclobacteriaceae bacterium]
MAGVKIIVVDGTEILEVDYRGAKPVEMIDIFDQATEVLTNNNKPMLVMSLLQDDNYGTPDFIRHIEKQLSKHGHLIIKQAVIGLNLTKRILLTGLNIFLQRNFKAFDTREEGLQYLLQKNSEEDLPDHFKKRKS